MEVITQYLQASALALGAIWNVIMAYEAYPKVWRVVFSALVALLLAIMACNKAFPFYG
jgi:hypothetical protein